MMKVYTILAVLFLLAVSLAAFALAEEISDINEIVQETIVSGDLNAATSESNQALADSDERVVQKSVTLADGWIVTSGLKGEFVKAFWISKRYAEVNQAELQRIKEQHKSDRNKIKNEIKKSALRNETKAFGRLYIGSGSEMEKYKLVKREINENSSSFYIVPINEQYSEEELASRAVGRLDLNKEQYNHITLWSGVLAIRSGKYAGEWKADAASKTKVFRNIDGSGSGGGASGKSFWRKLFFWIKD